MKRTLPLIITFLAGVFVVVTFFIPREPFGSLEQRMLVWYSILGGFTLLLGIDSLIKHHTRKVARREKDWFYSLVTLFGLFGTLAAGIVTWAKYGTPLELASLNEVGGFFWVYKWIMVPLQGTMFALLAFFIASAAYRAFRARTFDATLLLIAAILVMIGRLSMGVVPATLILAVLLVAAGIHRLIIRKPVFGAVLAALGVGLGVLVLAFPQDAIRLAPQVQEWLMSVPQTAARRGILIGVTLGTIAMSIRIILGIERTYISST
ncbi:hypothetical protein CEE36_01165 [candidate division TA06 bacterium B3_TA06]|uniref:Uncharacterized protein n=1 Tax=candidate division TA06 bacterium B3_TA06 TaxID=2012487 RepID=A0A532VB53_UNCT6|nr:MAG: hypothetical protein CEE36_01165 [candidate division TA06 bacterium B3_TA06]